MDRRIPPRNLKLPDAHNHTDVEFTLAGELIIRRGMLRFDLTHEDTLTLLRWLLWHGLRGEWAPQHR